MRVSTHQGANVICAIFLHFLLNHDSIKQFKRFELRESTFQLKDNAGYTFSRSPVRLTYLRASWWRSAKPEVA